MIGTIRKHSKWLWAVIITLTIITFVFWGTQSRRFQGGPEDFGRISGETVTRSAYLNAQKESTLHFFMTRGEWPDNNKSYDAQRETYFWLFLLQKQRDLGIHVPAEVAARAATERLRMLNRGNPLPLSAFAKEVLDRRGLTIDDFDRYMRHWMGLQQLQRLVAAGGTVTPMEEVRALYARENQEFSTQAAFFSASNYLDQVTVTPDAVALFYTNRMADYRIPERLRVSYIKFPGSNHLTETTKFFSELTNLNEIVEAQYHRLGTNYFSEAKTPEEAKEKTKEWMFKRQMMVTAQKKANDVAGRLFESPLAGLPEFARTNQLTVEVTEPFDREDPPKGLKADDTFVKAAFGLTAEEPYAGPLIGEDAIYIIAKNQTLPSENPPFESVREKVTWDYKFSQAAALARKSGEAFSQTVTNGMAAGKGFVNIATEAKVKPVLPPPFSLTSPKLPEVESFVSLGQYKRTVLMTAPGKVSPFIPMRDGGFLVYVAAKLPLDETKMRAKLPEFAEAVRRERQNEAFGQWFNQEASRALRETPLARQQPQMSGGQ